MQNWHIMAKLIFSIQATLLDTRWSKLRIDLTTTLHNTNQATIMCSCVENDIMSLHIRQCAFLKYLTWQECSPDRVVDPPHEDREERIMASENFPLRVFHLCQQKGEKKSRWECFECFTLISMILIVRQLMRRALSPWTAWSWSWGSSRGGLQRSWRPPSPPPSPHTNLPPASLWHHY